MTDDTLTDRQRRRARIRMMTAISRAMRRAEADRLPDDDVHEILGYARHGLAELDSYLERMRAAR